ncbi:hypothetical protein KEM56_001522 [Ascosphaera pollenicola]|nr:hypothetical protein KEM56_001522 [Ascosphaera pollenicola]
MGPQGHTTSASSGSPTNSLGATYQERAQRLRERQEAREIREAMEKLSLEKDEEEKRLYEAARKEAVDLVLSHQKVILPKYEPTGPYRNPDLRWRRRLQRREGANGKEPLVGGAPGQLPPIRTFSCKDEDTSPQVSASKESVRDEGRHSSLQTSQERDNRDEGKPLSILKTRGIPKRQETTLPWLSRRRQSSGRGKRIGSSGSSKGVLDHRPSRVRFDPTTKSWAASRALRSTDNTPSSGSLRSRLDLFELQKNPPTQSKNPQYTANPSPNPDPDPAGRRKTSPDMPPLEIRSEEIRAATTMRLKDRSPRLPQPTAVSDAPKRPIVSFQKEWEPPAAKKNDDASTQPALMITPPSTTVPNINVSQPEITIDSPSSTRNRAQNWSSRNTESRSGPSARPRPPSGAPVIPSINISEQDEVCNITVPSELPPTSGKPSSRPLPTPGATTNMRRGINRADQAATPSWRTPYIRTGVPAAVCDACSEPIAGRVVTACNSRFHSRCFACYHCQTPLECVAFYQEPESKRQERLAASNPQDPEALMQRFYCHLDFHEMFSPRCKSCKTPIEGEVIVACGAQYHVGHFFCAECGDPFSPTTPFVEKDGHAWCVNCHSKRTSPRCQGCKQLVMDDMIINALGGSWHSNCFNCYECGETISHESGFFVREGPPKLTPKGRQIGGPVKNPVCENCEKRRLKS